MIRKAACGLMMAAALLVSGQASANVLANPNFDVDDTSGGDVGGLTGWQTFNNVFNSSQSAPALSPDNVMKAFGTAGAFQDFAASEGQVWNGGAFVMNFSGDALQPGQIAAVNIEWLDAGGNQISFITNGTFDSTAPQDVWTQQTITGTAPAGTATARLTLITGPFDAAAGPGGGAAFYDNAFFEQIPEPGSLALVSLGGLALLRRRR